MSQRVIATVVAILTVGCAQATAEPPTFIVEANTIATQTLEIAPPTITPTETYFPPPPRATPTIEEEFINPIIESTLPYWTSTDAPITVLPDMNEGGLGFSLPPNAVARIGLGGGIPTLSPNAKVLAVGAASQVALLDAYTLEILWAVHMPHQVEGIAWSPDGLEIATWMVNDKRLSFFNAETGAVMRILTFSQYPVYAQWSSDGSKIAVADSINRHEYPPEAASIVILDNFGRTINKFVLSNDTSSTQVYMLTWSPDSSSIAIGTSTGMYLIDASTGMQLLYEEHEIGLVEFNPQGTILAGVKIWPTYLWNLQTGDHKELPISNPGYYVTDLDWSPDGTQVITANTGNGFPVNTEFQRWNAETGDLLHDYPNGNTKIYSVAWSPNGNYVAGAGNYQDWKGPSELYYEARILLWDAESDELSLAVLIPHYIGLLAWLPDSLSFISGGPTITHWNAQTGRPISSIYSAISLGMLKWNEDGRTLDIDPNAAPFEYKEYVTTRSPDGTLLASEFHTNEDILSTVRIADAESGEELFSFSDIGFVTAMDWSPDGTRLAVAASRPRAGIFGGNISIWDITSQTMLFTLDFEARLMLDVAWSPDGTMIAGAEGYAKGGWERSQENPVLVWDVKTQQEIHRFLGHTSDVYDVLWSPDGSLLASGSADGTVLIWDIP